MIVYQLPSNEPEDSWGFWDFQLYVGIAVIVLVVVGYIWKSWAEKRDGTEATTAGKQPPKVWSPKSVPSRSKKKKKSPAPVAAAPTVFISYRREDSSDVTGRMYDRLSQHFGKQSVFKDVDSIPLGVDFRKHLGDSVGKCDVLIAVIGKQWVSGEGGSRLNDERDFVRVEIEAALQRDIPVVPVLVQGAQMPREGDLPTSLHSLSYRNGIAVRPDPDFHQDMDRLIKGIEGHLRI
ncbi:MAG: toll/interleukin-1 receptor domain-containing protein [Bacteroidetes bacterium]|nr:toll/interleukin-1 receptor domain-containing protein [Bacteroidota bacterium]MCW5897520.1 toll/interleukin-1 receptor domain-containing protein [Bacteroidota bacterium]